MSRKAKQPSLGRSLLRSRDRRLVAPTSGRHTTDFGSTNTAISITENTSLDEFLSNAEASQRNFEAERGKARIVRHENDEDIMEESDEEEDGDGGKKDEDEDSGDEEDIFCSIPKKPNWRESESAEEFQRVEQIDFLKWKKRLNKMQNKYPNLPPFEKNLEFWRQFWKIIEISDVVIQVVDARDPLFFFSQDLADYVQEVSESKISVVLMNKADFLTQKQREQWAKHFQESDMKCIFFSAVEDEETSSHLEDDEVTFNTPRIFAPPEVLEILQNALPLSPLTVGFLGYPNVGKSSTINRFLTNKKLQVSATPGKTKHYQTHVLNGEIKLVDGPGLVIPNLSMTKADMVLAGILSIDNLTDFLPSADLLLTKVPFAYLQKHYGIMNSCVTAARKADRKSPSMQILSALGLMRGYMKPGGVPDQFRSAKLIFKDYVQGKLLFAKAPPGLVQEEFFSFDIIPADANADEEEMPLVETLPELRAQSGVHTRGVKGSMKAGRTQGDKKRKEKARRLYAADPYM